MMRLIHSSVGILVSSLCLSRSSVSLIQTGALVSLVQEPGIHFIWQCGLVLWLKAGWNNWRVQVKEPAGLWNSESCMRAKGSLVEICQVPTGGKGLREDGYPWQTVVGLGLLGLLHSWVPTTCVGYSVPVASYNLFLIIRKLPNTLITMLSLTRSSPIDSQV